MPHPTRPRQNRAPAREIRRPQSFALFIGQKQPPRKSFLQAPCASECLKADSKGHRNQPFGPRALLMGTGPRRIHPKIARLSVEFGLAVRTECFPSESSADIQAPLIAGKVPDGDILIAITAITIEIITKLNWLR